MSTPADAPAAERPLLSLEDVSAAAFTIGAGNGLAERAARLLALIRAWGEPSAVLAFVRDPSAEAGLRALPELSFGHVGQGQERTLARLVDEAGPARLALPWLIPPPPEVAGYRVKPLDSWLIPWTGAERSSGLLLLRGIAAPYPANLAQAVALAAQGVWALVPPPAPAGVAVAEAASVAPEPAVAIVAASSGEPILARLSKLEEAARSVQALVDELRQEQDLRAAEAAAPAPQLALRESVEAVEHARRDTLELREQCEALARARAEAESERDQAQVEATSWRLQAEALRARVESAPPASEAEASATTEALAAAQQEAAGLRERVSELDSALARTRAEVEAERDRAQVEATSWRLQTDELRARLEGAPPASEAEASATTDALEATQQEAAGLRERVSELDSALARTRAEAEAERDQARIEATSWRIQADALRTRLEGAPPPSEAEASATAEALDAARQEAAGLRERVSELDSALESAHAEATVLHGQLAERETASADTSDTAELRAQLAAERTRNESDRHALGGARQALRISEEMLASQTGELESVRRQRANLQEQIETAQRARAAAEAERDRARAEVNPLWGTIESLQRQLQDEQAKQAAEMAEIKARDERLEAQLAELRARAAQAAAAAGEGAEEHSERARQAEERAATLERRWEASVSALRAAYLALRRTPFVPPTLRLSFAGAEALFDAEDADAGQRGAGAGKVAGKRQRVLLLDRDTPSLEALAAELEAEGVGVLVAHYADEAAFFLKTPEARQLTALVADVMAFRSDAELLERFRVWRLDLPALGLAVSYRADDMAETERAKHLPSALGAGHIARPLACQALLDAVALSARRATRPTEASVPPRPPAKR